MIVTQKGVDAAEWDKMAAMRRKQGSVDSDSRSVTPSQVCVQVGTRWDNCTSLLNKEVPNQSIVKSPSSASCPDLEPGNNVLARTRAPSIVECDPRSPPHSAGASFPLAWSSHTGHLPDDHGDLSPPPSPSPKGWEDPRFHGVHSPTNEASPYLLMSRRDSRKLHDLEVTSKAKNHVFLKVPSPVTAKDSLHTALHHSKSDSEVVSQQRSSYDGDITRTSQNRNWKGDTITANRRTSFGGNGRDFHSNDRRSSEGLCDFIVEGRVTSAGSTSRRESVESNRRSSAGSFGRPEVHGDNRRGSNSSNDRRGSRGTIGRPEFVVDSRRSSAASGSRQDFANDNRRGSASSADNRSRSRCSEGEVDLTAYNRSHANSDGDKVGIPAGNRRGSQVSSIRDNFIVDGRRNSHGCPRKEGMGNRESQSFATKEHLAAEGRRFSQEERERLVRKLSDKTKHAHGQNGGAVRSGGPPPVPRHLSDSSIDLSQRNYRYSDENITRVLDMLYLGNIKAAFCEPILCRLSIEGIVDLSDLRPTEVPADMKSICPCTCPLETAHHRTRLCINIGRKEGLDIHPYMSEVNRFIESVRKRKKNVLVHCYHGSNRGPAFVIQYLMSVHHLPLATSYAIVKAASKTRIALHRTFKVALQNLERELWPGRPPSVVLEKVDVITPVLGVPKSTVPPTRNAWQ